MRDWDKKESEPLVTLTPSRLRNYLALFAGIGMITGYLLCMAL